MLKNDQNRSKNDKKCLKMIKTDQKWLKRIKKDQKIRSKNKIKKISKKLKFNLDVLYF